MKITFRIEYRTVWGENMGVTINGNENQPVLLNTIDGINWEGETDCCEKPIDGYLTYRYGVYKDNTCIRRESGNMPHLIPHTEAEELRFQVNDHWKELPANSFLYSSAFSERYEPRKRKGEFDDLAPNNIVFRAICPPLRQKHQKVRICGSVAELGEWNPAKATKMIEVRPNEWFTAVNASQMHFPITYKFVVYDEETEEAEEWEHRDNRIMDKPSPLPATVFFTPETELQFESAKSKAAGIAIPVFSLRSEGSFGVGDFGDLKQLIDWTVLTHQRVIQILPINDTTNTHTWIDSYPYNSISIYAFHPMYVDLRQVGKLRDREKQTVYDQKRKELNALPQLDYEAVNQAKRSFLKLMFKQDGKRLLRTKGFKNFFHANARWLEPYAAFSYLRDEYGTSDFARWPEYALYRKEEIDKLCAAESPAHEEIAFHYYVQYLLHIQLSKASDYAREKGIILKGDIPIGISRHSVEAWTEPHYFNMDGQTGAPPDAFSVKGQNWGFPTYNWEIMEQYHYLWWQKRLSKMAEYFTAYRIDHILGFFRIWEIPTHSVHGLLGQFVPALPMSAAEIESYGLPFQQEFMTKPFISERMIAEIFGEKAAYVSRHFLKHEHHDIYSMQSKFDTQRKVEAFFAEKLDQESQHLKEGLYALISDVLFVPDRKHPEMYHPRIAVQNDYVFRQLSWKEAEAFNRLYNDYYYKRHNQFWYDQAMRKLPVLTQATPMLVCGEDLGMVPECVPWVMNQLQILSLEIQRMPKDPRYEFGHVWEYPYRSVCTISTHDMSTLRGWWEEDFEQTSRFYKQILGHWDETPQAASGAICEEIVRRHLECPSALCILSFQDWTSMDEEVRCPDTEAERINIPSVPRHYWRYRMHLSIEALTECDRLNEKISALIDQNERN